MRSRTLSAVPTGTVDLSTTMRYSVMCSAMVSATASTYCRSAEPSSSGGVPTAMNWNRPCSTASLGSLVKWSRPAAMLRSTIWSRSGSQMGMIPWRSLSIFSWSTSMHITSLPTSARQAPVTRPT